MAQRRRSGAGNGRKEDLAPKLIGVGLLLAIVPLFLSKSPLGTALRPMIPLGLLLLVVGCAMLWWQIRSRVAKIPAVSVPVASNPPTPFRRSSSSAPPVDRTSTERDRMTAASAPQSTPRAV